MRRRRADERHRLDRRQKRRERRARLRRQCISRRPRRRPFRQTSLRRVELVERHKRLRLRQRLARFAGDRMTIQTPRRPHDLLAVFSIGPVRQAALNPILIRLQQMIRQRDRFLIAQTHRRHAPRAIHANGIFQIVRQLPDRFPFRPERCRPGLGVTIRAPDRREKFLTLFRLVHLAANVAQSRKIRRHVRAILLLIEHRRHHRAGQVMARILQPHIHPHRVRTIAHVAEIGADATRQARHRGLVAPCAIELFHQHPPALDIALLCNLRRRLLVRQHRRRHRLGQKLR